jgi:hypothetical protein
VFALALGLLPMAAACTPRGQGRSEPPPPVFTGAEVQKVIDANLPQTFPGLRVGPSRCPAQVNPLEGKPVACSLPVEGVPVRIRVERVDRDRFSTSTDQAVIPLARLEAEMGPLVSKKAGQSYAVDCGDEAVKVFDPPGTLRCVATSAQGKPVLLKVTISDRDGNFTFEQEQ